jgi:hypothetical protein
VTGNSLPLPVLAAASQESPTSTNTWLAHPLLDLFDGSEKTRKIEFLTFQKPEKSHNEYFEPVNDSTELGQV